MSIKCISCPHRNQFVRSYCKSSNKVGFPFPRALHPLFLLSCSSVSFETLAAALIIGLFALFIVVYTICLQCCWSNRRCPWFLDKEDSVKDKYTFCPCVQGIQSPDSWQSAPDLEQVRSKNASKSDYFFFKEFLMNISGCYSRLGWSISPCLCEHECQSCRLRLRQNLQNVSWIGQKILRDPDVSSSSDNYSSGRGKSGTQTATLLKKEMYHHNHSTLFLVVPCHYKILLLLNACCAEKHW